nr:serine/threonine-protein kinase [Haloechinothrix aidingensis]
MTSELGRGGMGVVWRARDSVIGREVAVKELRLPDGERDAGTFAERILREVRTGGRLNDPAVVTVYDVITEGTATFIVMELVEAPTLSELVAAHGPMPPSQVAAVGEQVLSALRSAHHAGIVHRDVKPGNIMVSAGGRVKLTDFGIAQAVDDPRLTTSGALVGSPAFMAPERVAGGEAVPASDLWSLGAALFFAVEGVVPFERASTAATLHAIMNEVPYLTRVHGPLASAIMGLLAAGPDGRITAEQAQGLLSMARSGAAASTPPDGHPTLTQPAPTMIGTAGATASSPAARTSPAKRGMTVAGAVVVTAALLAAGAVFGYWLGSPGQDEARLATLTRGADGDITFGFDTRTGGICGFGRFAEGHRLTGENQVACDEPHDYEVYDSAQAVTGPSWNYGDVVPEYPGEKALADYAEQRCETGFYSDAVVAEYQDRPKSEVLSYRAIIPTEGRWTETDEEGEPDGFYWVACVVTHRDGGQLKERVSRYLQ